jgi:uncharacterized RDD family membrane protein YckC
MASTTRSAPIGRATRATGSPRASTPRGGASGPSTSKPAAPASLSVVPASVPRRLVGAFVDGLLILAVVALVWSRVAPQGAPVQVRISAETGERISAGAPLINPDWLSVLTFAVAAVYVIAFLALAGRTPGGWAVGIRCIRADTGGKPGWAMSSRRWLVLLGIPAAIGLLPIIGPWAWVLTIAVLLSPLADRSGRVQGIHDRVAGDLVIYDRAAV